MTNLYNLFALQASKSPYAEAIVFEGQVITYKELISYVVTLSKQLTDLGVVPGDHIIIQMSNSVEALASMLAVLRLGAVILPLDISYPYTRVKQIYQESCTALMLSNTVYPNKNDDIKIVPVISFHVTDTIYDEQLYLNAPDIDIAFCIYTSGSSGVPKGVLLTHQAIIDQIFYKKRLLDLSSKSILCLSLNISFVASIWQLFGALTIGAKLVIYPQRILCNPWSLFECIQLDKVHVLSAVPQVVQSYCLLAKQRKMKVPLSSLQFIILTGEALTGDVVRNFYELYNIPIINAYGQSECSDDTFFYNVPNDFSGIQVPIGTPAAGVIPYVVDGFGHFLEGACEGELYIGGKYVSRGYWNDPVLTAEKFVHHTQNGSIIFRTGDLVERLVDGNYLYKGRLDNQYKVRGFRVSLEEVEYHIRTHPAIYKAAVVLADSECDYPEMIAYYISCEDVEPKQLIEFLLQTLPNYFIPTKFIRVEDFCYTTSGKLDRKRTLAEFRSGTIKKIPPAKPSDLFDKLVSVIADIIASEMNMDIVESTRFDALNMDSIRFIKIVIAIEDQFDIMFDSEMLSYVAFSDVASLSKYILSILRQQDIKLSKTC